MNESKRGGKPKRRIKLIGLLAVFLILMGVGVAGMAQVKRKGDSRRGEEL